MAHKGQPAFRCKGCGHLESAEAAGENAVPMACSVCGEGVRFNACGVKSAAPENWEVLADAGPERLAAIGVESVVRHIAAGAPPDGRSLTAAANDGPGTADAS